MQSGCQGILLCQRCWHDRKDCASTHHHPPPRTPVRAWCGGESNQRPCSTGANAGANQQRRAVNKCRACEPGMRRCGAWCLIRGDHGCATREQTAHKTATTTQQIDTPCIGGCELWLGQQQQGAHAWQVFASHPPSPHGQQPTAAGRAHMPGMHSHALHTHAVIACAAARPLPKPTTTVRAANTPQCQQPRAHGVLPHTAAHDQEWWAMRKQHTAADEGSYHATCSGS